MTLDKLQTAIVEALIAECPKAGGAILESVPAMLREFDEPAYEGLLELKPFLGKARSIRSQNALLDLREFMMFLCDQVIDIATIYAAPALCLPVAIRMMQAARGAVTKDLDQVPTAVLIALHLRLCAGAEAPTIEELKVSTRKVLKDKPFDSELPEEAFDRAVNVLSAVGAIRKEANNRWVLADKVVIQP